MVDTRHSIKSRVDLAFRREPPREERKREPGHLSCITRAGQHSSVSIEPTWLPCSPRTMPGTRYCARERPIISSARPFSSIRVSDISRPPPPLAPIFRPPSSFPDLRAPRPTVDLLPLPLFALPTSLVFRVIKDHPGPPTSPSRYARPNRIDFRLPRSRRRQNTPAPASRSKEEISSYS